RFLLPVALAQAKPVHLAAGVAVAIQVLQRALSVAVLPGVDARLLGPLKQLLHALWRVPCRLMLTEEFIEVRISIDRIAAQDQPRDGMRAELDRRQQGGRRISRAGRRNGC